MANRPERDPLDTQPGESLESIRARIERQQAELKALTALRDRLAPYAKGRENATVGELLDEARREEAKPIQVPTFQASFTQLNQSLEYIRTIKGRQKEFENLSKLRDILAPHIEGRENEPIGPILEELGRKEREQKAA